MIVNRSIIAVLLALGVTTAAQAHSPGVPSDPNLLAKYRAGLAAYLKQDYAAALQQWRPIAESGNSAAQLLLGFMHANGQGVTQDTVAAADWYGRAAEQDNMLAQLRLAMMLRREQATSDDLVQAYLWASLAARDHKHLQNVARALREALAQTMTPEQVAEARQLTRDWLAKHKTGN